MRQPPDSEKGKNMKSSGNGDVGVCVNNLLRTLRYEVRNDIMRGLPPELIDKSANKIKNELNNAGRWLVETYEPRADIEDIDLDINLGAN